MSDYLVDIIFILVFHCDVQRHDIRWVVVEGFDVSDVDYVLVAIEEVTDYININYIIQLDVVIFNGAPPSGSIFLGGPFPAFVGGYSRNPKTKWLVAMVPYQVPPRLLRQYLVF